jgi:outer membrane protein assembly factor BamB
MRILITVIVFAMLIAASAAAADAQDFWPCWRGPNETGVARGDAPLQWSDKEHVVWKIEVPCCGQSTPVIWGDRIFITTAVPMAPIPKVAVSTHDTGGALPPMPGGDSPQGPGGDPQSQSGPPPGDSPGRGGPPSGGSSTFDQDRLAENNAQAVEHKFMVIAYDRQTGKKLWENVARVATPHEGHHPSLSSFANSSPVVDARHVIVTFGSRGVYCYTHDGKLVWQKDFGVKMKLMNEVGEGASPALDGNTLVLTYDFQSDDSFIVALDKSTGSEIWRAARPRVGAAMGQAWSSPVITTVNGKKQVVVAATKFVAGYDLETGKVIWRATGLGGSVISMPIVSDGIAWVMSGYDNPNGMAIRLDREGDLTGTDAILWQNNRGNSFVPSPALYEGKLYLLADAGMLSCFDFKTGKAYYKQTRLPQTTDFRSSLVAANGKLYASSVDGDIFVIRAGENFEVLATNTLSDQKFVASPAIADGAIYLRGQNALFCIK